jgi:hypothetical protein
VCGPLALTEDNPPTTAPWRSDLPVVLPSMRCIAGDDVEVIYVMVPINLDVSVVHSA